MPATAAELAALHKITSSTGYRHVYRMNDSRRSKPYRATIRRLNYTIGRFASAKEAAVAVVEYLRERGNVPKKAKHSE